MRGLLIFALCATAVYGATLASGDEKEPAIGIVSQTSELNPDGSFSNQWQSENGISFDEKATVSIVDDKTVTSITGKFSYMTNEGEKFELTYVADETGFHPTGVHLPTPPPIPADILRSLEYIKEHPYVEEEVLAKKTRR